MAAYFVFFSGPISKPLPRLLCSNMAAPMDTVVQNSSLKVVVIIGECYFYIPENLITSRSKFFAAVVPNCEPEPYLNEKVIELHEYDPDIFEWYEKLLT